MTTVLAHVQAFCERQGLPVPSAMVGSQEKSARQFKGIMNDLVQELCEYNWQQQRIRTTWTSLAAASQGTLVSIFGAGYKSLVPNTLWNETKVMRIHGPVPENAWQSMQVLPNPGPEYQCWIAGDILYISPTLTAGDTLAGIYITKYGVLSSALAAQASILADDDTLLFPDIVISRGIEYKWRKAKGSAGWEDDYNAFAGLIAKNIVKDTASKLRLDSPEIGARPGVTIPTGSWNV